MTNTLHTPGPWRSTGGSHETWIQGQNRRIAVIQHKMNDDGETQNGADIAVEQANARLIAAAPELLQTMLAAKQFVENLPENILDKSLMLSHMNSVIAKSRGQLCKE